MINAITFAILAVYFNNKEAIDVVTQHLLWMFETWIATIVERMEDNVNERRPPFPPLKLA